MDLQVFDKGVKAQEDGLEIEIKHPSKKTGIGIFFTVCGPDSDRQILTKQKIVDERAKRQAIGRLTQAELEKEGFEGTCSFVTGYRDKDLTKPNVLILDGEELPFSEENVQRVLSRYRFMFDQVDAASQDRSRFFSY